MADKAPANDKPGAEKRDVGKVPMRQGLLQRFPNALHAVALVSEYGYRKYGMYEGWEKVPDAYARYGDAFNRHDTKVAAGRLYDDTDSGLAEIALRCWNDLATLELAIRDGRVLPMRGNDIADGKPVLGTAKASPL